MLSSRVSPAVGDGPPAGDRATPSARRPWLRGLSLFGLVSLTFLLGAAVIFFDLPPASFLRRAFVGGAAWYEQKGASQNPDEGLPPPTVGQVDKPDKTCDGFTLLLYGEGTPAVLVNMRGDVVHRWHAPFSKVWPDRPGWDWEKDKKVYYTDGHLEANGDLLVVMEGPTDWRNPSSGFGLARLDRDSRVLWKYRDNYHHGIDVGEDGTIYAISSEILQEMPQGLEYIPAPCLIDVVDVIPPEGPRKRIRLLEAFRDSPYAPLLCMLERSKRYGHASPPAPPGVVTTPPFLDEQRRRDVLHVNAVKVLRPALAAKFPLFKAGQLLVSPRNLDAVAVLDPDSGKVVWAARGPWRAQHDPSFLDNGHLLLFDNMGSPHGSRVLEYDPQDQSFPWSYPGANGTPFYTRLRGTSQRLPNGNTLIVNSDGGEVFEVTPDREVVWSCSCGRVDLYRARRYTPDQLPFLKGQKRARP
jgi:hypothetical protein